MLSFWPNLQWEGLMLRERVADLEAESKLQWEMILQLASNPQVHRMKWRAIAQEFAAEAPALARLVEPSSDSWNAAHVDFLIKQV